MLRSAACNNGVRTTNRSGLVRLLRTETRSSNEDHTMRHINPDIVRSGWGSEASMTQCDLTCVQDVNTEIFPLTEVEVFCSRNWVWSCGMCCSGYSAALLCPSGNYCVRPVMDCDNICNGVSFCLNNMPTGCSPFYSGSTPERKLRLKTVRVFVRGNDN